MATKKDETKTEAAATATTAAPKPVLDYVKYVGAHPHVAIGDFGEFTRNEPRGPLSEETIKILTKEDAKDKPKGWKPEFVRCAAPPPKKVETKKEVETSDDEETT